MRAIDLANTSSVETRECIVKEMDRWSNNIIIIIIIITIITIITIMVYLTDP